MDHATEASNAADDRYIGVGERRRLIPVSDMTIWRWVRDPAVAFPSPIKLGRYGRNYWWLPAVREWQRQREGARPGSGEGA
jgi:predicted DNA-binding transcriptional regulator AlpA